MDGDDKNRMRSFTSETQLKWTPTQTQTEEDSVQKRIKRFE